MTDEYAAMLTLQSDAIEVLGQTMPITIIREVVEASPAARAGLAPGDLIVAAASQPARTPDDLFDALAAARGGTLELKVVRGTDERTLQVTFTEPDQNA